ncbi:sensor histidine kinase [Clostridium formicaceticum]|uniref:Histidine kinase n=1 Tax=Clostridium formicaceticum TaxID=1497 RepID=A0AAC9RNJ3_9CLOT|nr:sensor histidine kinase [Clostridium formicaceticum]AOY74610.1 histidine kinase [Clostridium formicaceticum]ARE88974.1 Sensor histidine kinase YehU [Clostridium formicaceticum]
MNKVDNPLKKLIASNLYTRYSGILSLSDISLFLVDTNGDILLELIPSPDFCSHVCMERGDQVCPDYRNRFKSDEAGSFVCRYGLENILLPIKVKDETMGYIAGMQVYSQDTEYKKYMIDVQSLKNDRKVELEFIAKSIASLKTVELNKIKIHEQLCRHIAKNISLDLSESVSQVNPHVARLSIEKEMLEKKIIDLEAKNMSLVINPHFLFNTLNCIARIAYFEHSHTTEELIYCLSDLLRYNLKQDDQLHTIASEIDNIEKYLYIQKARFKNRLEYSIDVPEKIKSYRIPNMVIQPIVENALIHGITPKRDGGKISIYAEKSKGAIVISIADNGNGFPKDVLDKIQQCENKSGLGFRSTDKRLKQYYGEGYGLEIVKSDYSGSTITITIPTQPLGGASDERHLDCGR